MRPAELSDDHTGTTAVVAHTIDWLQQKGRAFENVCCLYATAPFVSSESLRKGLDMLTSQPLDYCFSATEFSFPIQRAFRLDDAGRVAMFQPEHFATRSQDLESAYHDAGQFYWGTYAAFSAGKPFFSANSMPVILPGEQVQDIDTQSDWDKAVLLYRLLQPKVAN